MTPRLPDLCTTAQYEAATPEQQMDFDRRWMARCMLNAERAEQRDYQADYDDARADQDWWLDIDTRGEMP